MVNAVEVVHAFDGDEGLIAFRRWVLSPDTEGIASAAAGGGRGRGRGARCAPVTLTSHMRIALEVKISLGLRHASDLQSCCSIASLCNGFSLLSVAAVFVLSWLHHRFKGVNSVRHQNTDRMLACDWQHLQCRCSNTHWSDAAWLRQDSGPSGFVKAWCRSLALL